MGFTRRLGSRNIGVSILIGGTNVLPGFGEFSHCRVSRVRGTVGVGFCSYICSVGTLLPVLLRDGSPKVMGVSSSTTLVDLTNADVCSTSGTTLGNFARTLHRRFHNGVCINLIYPNFAGASVFHSRGGSNNGNRGIVSVVSASYSLVIGVVVFNVRRGRTLRVRNVSTRTVDIFNGLLPMGNSHLFDTVVGTTSVSLFGSIFEG